MWSTKKAAARAQAIRPPGHETRDRDREFLQENREECADHATAERD